MRATGCTQLMTCVSVARMSLVPCCVFVCVCMCVCVRVRAREFACASEREHQRARTRARERERTQQADTQTHAKHLFTQTCDYPLRFALEALQCDHVFISGSGEGIDEPACDRGELSFGIFELTFGIDPLIRCHCSFLCFLNLACQILDNVHMLMVVPQKCLGSLICHNKLPLGIISFLPQAFSIFCDIFQRLARQKPTRKVRRFCLVCPCLCCCRRCSCIK